MFTLRHALSIWYITIITLQKYSLIGLGAAAVVGITFFGGRKAYRYHLANKRNTNGMTPLGQQLMDVKSIDDLRKITTLIEQGARVNENEYAPTPLRRAVMIFPDNDYLDLRAVSILLEHGAQLDLQSRVDGNTALSEAAHLKKRRIVNLLIDRGANPNLGPAAGNAIFKAIKKEDIPTVNYILNNTKVKINLDARDNEGNTLLMAACYTGDVELVKTFIGLGVDISAKNKKQEVALWVVQNDFRILFNIMSDKREAMANLLQEAARKQSVL